MAHELDRKADGSGAMFSVRETPWHKEGVVLSDAPRSVDDALKAAGLDFDVECRPVFQAAGEDDYVEIPDARVVVRTDRGAALGVVGNYYTPLQNRDALRILEPLIDQGLASFETAGSLRDGRDIWAMIRFNIDHPIVQEVFADEVVPFGIITNNHSGARQVTLGETPIRVVCANTLGVAQARQSAGLDKVEGVRHTATMESKLVAKATALWAGIVERHVTLATQYRALKGSYLDEALFRQLVLDNAIPLPEDAPTTKREETTRAQIDERRGILTGLWTGGRGHTGDHSAWEAYNGVVEALDHEDMGVFSTTGPRTQALMRGRLSHAKTRVYDALVSHAMRG